MDVLWAEGYRAESVSPGELERVRRYIMSQAEHHRAKFRFRSRQDAKHVDYGEASVPLAYASGWRLFGAFPVQETSHELVDRTQGFTGQPKAWAANEPRPVSDRLVTGP